MKKETTPTTSIRIPADLKAAAQREASKQHRTLQPNHICWPYLKNRVNLYNRSGQHIPGRRGFKMLKDDIYFKKQSFISKKMKANSCIALENGLSEEQIVFIENVCR